MTAKVIGIEYDPNRTCHIALLEYEDGTRRYILATAGMTDGDVVMSSGRAADRAEGRQLHAAQVHPDRPDRAQRRVRAGQGRQARAVPPVPAPASPTARVAGPRSCFRVGRDPPGVDRVPRDDRRDRQQRPPEQVKLGKAGRNRWRGRKPKVRGVAKDHACHPLGGGEGRSKSGREPASATRARSPRAVARGPRGKWTDAAHPASSQEQALRPAEALSQPKRALESAMSRSLKKGPFVDEKLYRKVEQAQLRRQARRPSRRGRGPARSCPSSSATRSRSTTAAVHRTCS